MVDVGAADLGALHDAVDRRVDARVDAEPEAAIAGVYGVDDLVELVGLSADDVQSGAEVLSVQMGDRLQLRCRHQRQLWLPRPCLRRHANGNQSWSYTPGGLPASVTAYNDAGASSVVNTYAYNKRRLLTGESQASGSNTWTVGYGYDANASLSTLVYPDSLTVSYAPNALGQPTQAGTYASNVTYYPNGAIAGFTYGNGIVHTLTQNTRGLPDRSQDLNGSTAIHDDSYDYDPVGNVLGISDAVTGNRGNRDMTYDALNRLTQVTGEAGAPSPMFGIATYTYDALDNLTHVGVTGGSQPRNYDYCYDEHNHLTNIMTGGCTGEGVIGLGYDAQGNLANRNGTTHTFTFDYGNRLRAGELETYRYDAQGRRIRSSSSAGLVYSLYAQSGQLLFQRDERSGKRRQYIYLGGSLVAESDMPLTGSTATVTYQHTDALGTPVAITNSSKTVIERREYEPYGYQTTPTLQDGPNYTGHVADAATGLIYMQARYYDPMLGLFVNVDPMPVDMTNGSNFNRYWYANSNPLTLIDPDGRATCADKKCETSTIDPVLPRGNSQPPPVNGTEGLPPKIADKVDDGYATTVTFQNDDPKGADPNQPVQTSTAVMVEHAISDASVNSVNINSTTGGKHGVHSNHARGRAVDINRVNGQRVNSSNAAAAQVQIAARNGGEVRENFGPTIMEKTSVPGGSPHHVDNASLAKDHQNHIHLSGQP